MANEIFGRRPDKDGICSRCKADGQIRHLAKHGIGRTFAYYAAPFKVKGQKAREAVWVHFCPFHMQEVTPV